MLSSRVGPCRSLKSSSAHCVNFEQFFFPLLVCFAGHLPLEILAEIRESLLLSTMSSLLPLLLFYLVLERRVVDAQCAGAVCRQYGTDCTSAEFSALSTCFLGQLRGSVCCRRQCAVKTTVTCGTSAGCFQRTTRTVTTPTSQATADCRSNSTDSSTPCTDSGCADCQVSVSAWSTCSVVCGPGGIQSRTRTMLAAAIGRGRPCTSLEPETRSCEPVPVDCTTAGTPPLRPSTLIEASRAPTMTETKTPAASTTVEAGYSTECSRHAATASD